MKEKLKKIWADHKDTITDYAIIGAGLGVVILGSSGIAWLEATRRANNKNEVVGADVYMNLSGNKSQSIIIVDHKDKTQTRLEPGKRCSKIMAQFKLCVKRSSILSLQKTKLGLHSIKGPIPIIA